ncbi:MAG: GIY-YIG nuclease family protein [Saprospirales bacterium]|nr:GIY-YIG nuclease family protein [Saprospirales bacterium]
MQQWWYVYILECANGKHYYGFTSNLKDRIRRHNEGLVQSTRNWRPVRLVCSIALRDKSLALAFEKFLKSGSGRAFSKKRLLATAVILKPSHPKKSP